jgi:hypothetical protein
MDTIKAETIALVAEYEWVALQKISKTGKPVGLSKAPFTSPMQNRMAMLIPKQRTPLEMMLHIIVLGTTIAAFCTSSAATLC